MGGRGVVVWFTGLPASGKTTLAGRVVEEARRRGMKAELLDADEIRRNLYPDLGFSKEDRDENVRRLGFLAELLARNGVLVAVAAISPYRAVREEIKDKILDFVEVYVFCPVEVCKGRDPKGLYRKAQVGEIKGLTGVDDPYEPPLCPDVFVDTCEESPDTALRKIFDKLERRDRSDSRIS